MVSMRENDRTFDRKSKNERDKAADIYEMGECKKREDKHEERNGQHSTQTSDGGREFCAIKDRVSHWRLTVSDTLKF